MIRLPVRANDFSLHPSVHTVSEAHPAHYSVGTGRFFPGCKTVQLTAHFHLVCRLRMSVAKPHSPISSRRVQGQFAFMKIR